MNPKHSTAPSMDNPSVSVLICTRDRPDQLERCLRSVFQLEFPDYEVIVVENASKQFSIPNVQHTRPTRYFSQPAPGLSYARNLAVRNARGEIVAFIDDDAIPERKWLTSGMKNFTDSNVGCVTGRVLPLETKTEWQERVSSLGYFPDSEERKVFDSSNFNPLSTSPGVGCNFFVRRTFFDNHEFSAIFNVGTSVGGEDERYLFHQIIQEGMKIIYEPSAIVHHEYAPTEAAYKKKLFTYSISHSALLTHFLLFEKGERLRSWRHLWNRIVIRPNGPPVPFRIRTRARLMAPIALIRSNLQAQKSRPLSLQQHPLLAEFPGTK